MLRFNVFNHLPAELTGCFGYLHFNPLSLRILNFLSFSFSFLAFFLLVCGGHFSKYQLALAGEGHIGTIVLLLGSRGYRSVRVCGFLCCIRFLLDSGSYFCFDCLVCVRSNVGEDSCAVGRAKLLINQGNAFNQVPYTLLTEASYTVCTLDCISFM
jgi:hypothetical protein